MTAVQLDLFTLLDELRSPAERQQADWVAWLQDDRGRWRCPACGELERSAGDLHDRHGWQVEIEVIGHPYPYPWPGKYAEGGYSGNGGRCMVLRRAWLVDHYGEWPPGPASS